MKLSEARIIIYLNSAMRNLRFPLIMATKLGVDYSNACKALKMMEAKGWLSVSEEGGKKIYSLTQDCPVIEEAIQAHQS